MLIFKITHWYRYHCSSHIATKKTTVLTVHYIFCPILHCQLITKLRFKCRASGSRIWSPHRQTLSLSVERTSPRVALCLDVGNPVSFILRKTKQLFDISIFLLFCHARQTNYSQHSQIISPIIVKHIYYRCLFIAGFQRTENIAARSIDWFIPG